MENRARFEKRLRDYDLNDAESKRSYNASLFSAVATRYTLVTRLLSFGRDQSWKRELLRMLPQPAARRCLDLACGTADITFALARRYPTGEVIGLDLNAEMLAKARRRYARTVDAAAAEAPGREIAPIRFVEGDMTALPYEDGSFDVLTGGYALRNAPDLDRALSEAHRVLAPGGSCGFLDFSRSPRPGLSRLQVSLLEFWGSIWGRILHGNSEVYAYIARSLAHFPDRGAFEQKLRGAGFVDIRSKRKMFGLLALTSARRAG